jgi:putative oxidoreductase
VRGPEPGRDRDIGALILRVFAGLALALAHGIGKMPPSEQFIRVVAEMGFPSPEAFAWAAGIAELAGGLLLAIGLLTRPAAIVIAITMLVAAILGEAGNPFVERERALLFGVIAIYFVLAGPGRYSVDGWFAARRF